MDASKLATWLQLIGNFGLLTGLILVAVQIRQNTDIATAQMLHDGWLGSISTSHLVIGENPAEALAVAQRNPAELTDAQMLAVRAFLETWWTHAARLEDLASRGYELYPPEEMGMAIASQMGNPFAIAWWEAIQGGFANTAPQTRDAVNRFIDRTGREKAARWHKNSLGAIKTAAIAIHEAQTD